MTVRYFWLNVLVPAAILFAAHALLPLLPALPASLAGLLTYGPAMLLAVAAAVALAFRRGRVVFAVLVLALALAAASAFLRNGVEGGAARAIYAGLWLFVPLDLAWLAVTRERGVFNVHALPRLAVLLAQIVATAWVIVGAGRALLDALYAPIFGDLAPSSPIPDAGLAIIATTGLTGLIMWWRTRSPVDLGITGALAAFAAAAHAAGSPHAYGVYIAAGALILAVAVLQDSFRMAFRDALTGLPSRRALEERLAGLGRHYTIAMVDVDHFKRFNDTYGHDLGDQVLKVVASRLAKVGGRGTAFRYGGEEFTVLFPARTVAEALPHLEALRLAIVNYAIALRAEDRPAKSKSGRRRRGTAGGGKTVSVSVSIGVAERNARLDTPAAVIGAADRALYRAKHKGRNQVSR